MKEVKKDKGDKWSLKRYGDPDKPKDIKREQWVNFLYDEAIEKILEKTDTPQDKDENQEDNKKWYNPADYPLAWGITGAILVIGGIAIWYFWENISSWWSSPAEEEGRIGEKEE